MPKSVYIIETKYDQDSDLEFNAVWTVKTKAIKAAKQLFNYNQKVIVSERLTNIEPETVATRNNKSTILQLERKQDE